MQKKIGTIGMILFVTGGSLEAAPGAALAAVLLPYLVMILGLLVLLISMILYHDGGDWDED